MAQSVKRLISAQVMVLRSVSSSPVMGSVLTELTLKKEKYKVLNGSNLSACNLTTCQNKDSLFKERQQIQKLNNITSITLRHTKKGKV